MSIRIELPMPPPLSACFTNFTFFSKKLGKHSSREVTTKRYEEWKKEAARMIRAQEWEPMLGEVNVRIRLVAPTRAEMDADNRNKAILDALVQNKIITNDSNRYVRDLYTQWRDDGVPCCVFVTPHIRKDLLL